MLTACRRLADTMTAIYREDVMELRSALVGGAAAIGARAAPPRLLKVKFGRDVTKLNAADFRGPIV